MLIKILKECKVIPKGKEEKVRVQPGQIVDLPKNQGKSVINADYGEEAEPEEVPDMTETGEVEELGELGEAKEEQITDAQRKRFFSLADEVFESDDERKKWLQEEFGTDSIRDLAHGQMNSAIAKLDREAGEVTYSSEKEATGARQALKQVDEEMEKQREREVAVPTVLDPDMIREYAEKVEELIEKVIDMKPHQKGGDIYYIGNDGSPTTNIKKAVNTYIGRSGLRKLALACNLEVEPIPEGKERVEHEDYYTWIYRVRVRMPNGRTYVQEGACSSNEAFFASGKGQVEEKDIVHTAETRAMNRAIMDIIGAPNISREQWAEG